MYCFTKNNKEKCVIDTYYTFFFINFYFYPRMIFLVLYIEFLVFE